MIALRRDSGYLTGLELSLYAHCALAALGLLRTEVNNGGFHQYLFNSARDSDPDAADAAQMAGADDLAALVHWAVARLGLADPRDRLARQAH